MCPLNFWKNGTKPMNSSLIQAQFIIESILSEFKGWYEYIQSSITRAQLIACWIMERAITFMNVWIWGQENNHNHDQNRNNNKIKHTKDNDENWDSEIL